MSIFWRCRTCGGVYQAVQPDGMLYFHACPPIVDAAGQPHERSEKRDENPAPGIVRHVTTAAKGAAGGEVIMHRGVVVSTAPIVADGRGREPV